MSNMGTSAIITFLLSVFNLIDNINGHGQMFEPPSRQSAFRLGYPTPQNYAYDMGLNCGGFGNQWQSNQGRCGICGDPYQGPREYEAGGKYATGLIFRNYTQGQTIDVHLNIRVGHGGWSELRICPNNNVHKPATQACLDQYLLALENGTTRITHYHSVIGMFKYKFRLPRGLTCTQCVLQWRWTTDAQTYPSSEAKRRNDLVCPYLDNNYCKGPCTRPRQFSNNNCVSNVNCCNGCGPQEQFYACADVAIKPTSTGNTPKRTTTPGRITRPTTNGFIGGFVPTRTTTPRRSTLPTVGPSTGHNNGGGFIGGFVPIDADVSAITSKPSAKPCVATISGQLVFGSAAADSQCQQRCQQFSSCPGLLCANSCFN